jgi:hypothetical protein
MAFLDRAATDKTLVGGYHFPFPGFARGARGEQLPLAAGRLAVDELTTARWAGSSVLPPPASQVLRRK